MKSKGFTLVELLVVIAIIGLLSTIAVVALEGSRSKSRDAKRLADVRNLSSALELYFASYNTYPSTGVDAFQTIIPNSGALQALVTDGILSKLPSDPQSKGATSGITEYYYGSPGWWDTNWLYQIQFQLENQNDTAGNRHPTTQLWGTRYMYSVHP